MQAVMSKRMMKADENRERFIGCLPPQGYSGPFPQVRKGTQIFTDNTDLLLYLCQSAFIGVRNTSFLLKNSPAFSLKGEVMGCSTAVPRTAYGLHCFIAQMPPADYSSAGPMLDLSRQLTNPIEEAT
jgi:hypothetical protein